MLEGAGVFFPPQRPDLTCKGGSTLVTLQVTDTVRSYELDFHPVTHGVTVSCERYTTGFPVCYRSPSCVAAAGSGFVHLYIQ